MKFIFTILFFLLSAQQYQVSQQWETNVLETGRDIFYGVVTPIRKFGKNLIKDTINVKRKIIGGARKVIRTGIRYKLNVVQSGFNFTRKGIKTLLSAKRNLTRNFLHLFRSKDNYKKLDEKEIGEIIGKLITIVEDEELMECFKRKMGKDLYEKIANISSELGNRYVPLLLIAPYLPKNLDTLADRIRKDTVNIKNNNLTKGIDCLKKLSTDINDSIGKIIKVLFKLEQDDLWKKRSDFSMLTLPFKIRKALRCLNEDDRSLVRNSALKFFPKLLKYIF